MTSYIDAADMRCLQQLAKHRSLYRTIDLNRDRANAKNLFCCVNNGQAPNDRTAFALAGA